MQAQSLISTLMRAKFGLYETRIFMRIVERCQELLPNNGFRNMAYKTPKGWNYRFSFTLSSLTSSHNYRYVKTACNNLKNITVQRYDTDTRQWLMAGLITQARIKEQSGILELEVADWVCDYIIDFRQGWRLYDLQKANTIRNPYALRLYLITCTQTTTLHYGIDTIRRLLLGDESHLYPNNGDFIRRCIIPAQKELEEKQLNGFTYTCHKANGSEKGKITQIDLIPVKRETKEENVSETRATLKENIPIEMLNYLTLQLGFTSRELKGKNMSTIAAFCNIQGWQEKFISITTRMRRHFRGHGWLINAMKKEAQQHED